jgi:alkylhydroperoxidase/carboxymuconolactone decarboxylase family protein YurZ
VSSHSGDATRTAGREDAARAIEETDNVVSEARELLRRLAAADERLLRTAMAPTPEFELDYALTKPALDRRTRVLVRLAALIAVGASTESLRWAVELASTSGADDDALAAVLVATASAAGSAQLVESAPRLALALGFDAASGSPADSY